MRIDLTQPAAYVQNSHRALAHQSLSGSQDSQHYSNHCHSSSVGVSTLTFDLLSFGRASSLLLDTRRLFSKSNVCVAVRYVEDWRRYTITRPFSPSSTVPIDLCWGLMTLFWPQNSSASSTCPVPNWMSLTRHSDRPSWRRVARYYFSRLCLQLCNFLHAAMHYIQGGPKNGASVFYCKYFENSTTDRIAWKLVNFCSIVCRTQ